MVTCLLLLQNLMSSWVRCTTMLYMVFSAGPMCLLSFVKVPSTLVNSYGWFRYLCLTVILVYFALWITLRVLLVF